MESSGLKARKSADCGSKERDVDFARSPKSLMALMTP
jgi:hypothetical protein